ncbi:unnamed protein product [Ixodes persulcatus]
MGWTSAATCSLLALLCVSAASSALSLSDRGTPDEAHWGLRIASSAALRDEPVGRSAGKSSATRSMASDDRQVTAVKDVSTSRGGDGNAPVQRSELRLPVTSGVQLEDYDDSTEAAAANAEGTTSILDLVASVSASGNRTTPEDEESEEEEEDEYGSTDDVDDRDTMSEPPETDQRTVSTVTPAKVIADSEVGNALPKEGVRTSPDINAEASGVVESQTTDSIMMGLADASPTTIASDADSGPTSSTTSVAIESTNVPVSSTDATTTVKADAVFPQTDPTADPKTSTATATSVTNSSDPADANAAATEIVIVTANVQVEMAPKAIPKKSGFLITKPKSKSGNSTKSSSNSTATTSRSTAKTTPRPAVQTKVSTSKASAKPVNPTSSPATAVSTKASTSKPSAKPGNPTSSPALAMSTEASATKTSTKPTPITTTTTAPALSAAPVTKGNLTISLTKSVETSNAVFENGTREVEDLGPTEATLNPTTTAVATEPTTTRDYQPEVNDFLNQLTSRLLPVATRFLGDGNLTSDCVTHLWKLYQGIRRQDAWALRLITASGILPANLFEGSLSNLGSYEQCLRTKILGREGDADLQGQYCTLYFRAPELLVNRTMAQFNAIGEMKGRRSFLSWERNPRGFANSDIRLGVCIPSGCSEDDMNFLANAVLRDYGAKATVQDCRVETPFAISELQIGILCALGGSVGLVLLATLVELCLICCSKPKDLEPKREGVPVKIVKCFSLVHNTKNLLNIESSIDCPKRPVRFVYGVKVFMAMWIILGHSYYTANFQTLHSGFQIMDLYSQVHAQLLGSAFYAISTFFFLSGFVLSYFMRRTKEDSIMRPFLGIYVFSVIRRYLRLTVPAMVVVLCFFLFPLFIAGPQDKDLMGQEQKGCYENWWTIMAQIVNFVPTEKRCMQQYWYISSDMQIYLVAVPLALIFVRSPACGFSLALLLSVLCSVAAGLVTYMKDLKPAVAYTIDDFSRNLETAEFVHELPYSNLATYFLGVVSGYCAATWNKTCINKVLQAFLWILALALNIFLVFVPYAWNRSDTEDLKQLYASFYGGSYRYLWGLSWCWIAYACATERGGILYRFLSWNPFVVLGRLTFGVYLAQYVVFLARLGVTTTPLQVNEFLQVKDSLGVAAISYFFAYLLHVVYEAPVNGIARLIFRFHTIRRSSNKPQPIPPESDSSLPPPEPPTPPPTEPKTINNGQEP